MSACVQMPSMPAIQGVQDRIGLPVISVATSAVYKILKKLYLQAVFPIVGHLLLRKF